MRYTVIRINNNAIKMCLQWNNFRQKSQYTDIAIDKCISSDVAMWGVKVVYTTDCDVATGAYLLMIVQIYMKRMLGYCESRHACAMDDV